MSKVFTPGELERMARLGQLGILTGDKVLTDLGKVHVQRAADIGEQQAVLGEKRANRQLLDRYYGSQEARWAREPQENELDRQLRRELAQLGIAGDLLLKTSESDDPNLSASQQTQAVELQTALGDVRDMRSRLESMPNVGSKPRRLFVEGAEMLAPERMEGTVGQLAKELVYSPEERQLMRDFSEQLAARIKAISGAAASDRERAFLESIMPRPGMSFEDLMSTTQRLEDYLETRASAAADPMGAIRGGPAPAGGDSRERRTIGGKSYVRVGPDEWEEE